MATGYLTRFLEKCAGGPIPAQNFPEILSEFQKMTEPNRSARRGFWKPFDR